MEKRDDESDDELRISKTQQIINYLLRLNNFNNGSQLETKKQQEMKLMKSFTFHTKKSFKQRRDQVSHFSKFHILWCVFF